MTKKREQTSISRRSFLGSSLLGGTAAVGALNAGYAFAQAAPPAAQSPASSVVNFAGEKVVQISMVVRDVQRVAKRFSDFFGPSWKFYDFRPKQVVLHDKALGASDWYLKLAVTSFGGRSFMLVQPVSGQSSYAEFLQKQGEGFYSVGLGAIANHDESLESLRKAGVGIEMQGDLGNSIFSVLDTVEDLGCRIEFTSQPTAALETTLQQTGTYVPSAPSIINMDRPVFSGGKKFYQVGIVVKDEKRAARRYEELLGMRDWAFRSLAGVTDAFLNEKPVPESQLPALDVSGAFGNLGDTQFELLKPAGTGPSCHQWFLEKHGNGIQHTNIGRLLDFDDVIATLKKAGIQREFAGRNAPAHHRVTYFAMQEQLGGFQLEIIGPL